MLQLLLLLLLLLLLPFLVGAVAALLGVGIRKDKALGIEAAGGNGAADNDEHELARSSASNNCLRNNEIPSALKCFRCVLQFSALCIWDAVHGIGKNVQVLCGTYPTTPG